jgi:hypothetical protein
MDPDKDLATDGNTTDVLTQSTILTDDNPQLPHVQLSSTYLNPTEDFLAILLTNKYLSHYSYGHSAGAFTSAPREICYE